MADIRYLETSEHGLRWMRTYYDQNPQLNFEEAVLSLLNTEEVLKVHPFSGSRFEDFDNVRQYQIGNTAFALLYTGARETIWIIDVRDTRGMRSADALRAFDTRILFTHGL